MSTIEMAIRRVEAAIAERGDAERFNALAELKLEAGDLDGAIDAYAKCLTFAPHNAAVYNNLGTALVRAARYGDAIAALETALTLRPGYQRTLVNLGKALREVGRVRDSIARLNEALALDPNYLPALLNLGDALAASGDVRGAERTLERAVELAPASIEARTSLGITRLGAGRAAEALETLRAAVELSPQHADAHSNLAHALFVLGDWRAAWPHFEHRFRRLAQRVRLTPPSGVQRWEGILSSDLELWVIGEQGLGDQLQFARYVKLLSDSGLRCVLACEPRLVQILSQARLAARVVPLDARPTSATARWVPLMSLPAWHATQPESVPNAAGYLVAASSRIDYWRAQLPPTQNLRVAIAWAGNPRMETGRHSGRSPPLAAYAPLLAVPGIEVISLQKGHGEDQLDTVPFTGRITRLSELDAGPDAFLDTAAVLNCVDLLITSDTAIAHLGGALGIPTWLCLTHEPDWRWMLQGDTTPWYTSMRLFRQPARGDWASVYGDIAHELAQLASRRASALTDELTTAPVEGSSK
jgi:tetratricopeptide (TPR) repeat protein